MRAHSQSPAAASGIGSGRWTPDALRARIALVAQDAERLDCVAEVAHARQIVARGTGAHRQIALYKDVLAAGAEPDEALRQVVDMLIAETTELRTQPGG